MYSFPNLEPVSCSMEKEVATLSSVLAWRILWTEKPGELLSIGSHRVRHDWSELACMHALEKEIGSRLQCSCLGNLVDREACRDFVYEVTQSQTRLKHLSSSSNSSCSMSSSNCCFLNCTQISQEAGQVVWYSHLLKNFPQFVVIHTVKGWHSQ